jgi:hypothetical protein
LRSQYWLFRLLLLRALQFMMNLGLIALHWSRSCDFRLKFLTPIVFKSLSESSHLTADLLIRRELSGLCRVHFLQWFCSCTYNKLSKPTQPPYLDHFCLARQIASILWKSNGVPKKLALLSVVTQMIPLHAMFYKIRFNVFPSPIRGSPRRSLAFEFPANILNAIFMSVGLAICS